MCHHCRLRARGLPDSEAYDSDLRFVLRSKSGKVGLAGAVASFSHQCRSAIMPEQHLQQSVLPRVKQGAALHMDRPGAPLGLKHECRRTVFFRQIEDQFMELRPCQRGHRLIAECIRILANFAKAIAESQEDGSQSIVGKLKGYFVIGRPRS